MRFTIVILICAAMIACGKEQKQLKVKTGRAEKSIRLAELKSRFGDTTVEVDDYYLHRKVRYRAISMPALLKALAAEAGQFDEFVFRCADGYLAHVARADWEAGKLDKFFLAFGEEGDAFKSKIQQGKAEVSPEPFYAVATDLASFSTLSWPYEVIAVELVDFKSTFPALYVAGMNKAASAGFDLFRRECLKCHSLNLQGGDIGPELNVPRNITEYRDDVFLKAFIRDASAYRAKSKMQSFAHLSDAQIGDVIAYLKVMRSHKIKP